MVPGEREERSIAGGRRGKSKERAKGWSALVSSCLHKAAPHQIAFVLNIWIGGCGRSRERQLRGTTRGEKGRRVAEGRCIRYSVYPTRKPARTFIATPSPNRGDRRG